MMWEKMHIKQHIRNSNKREPNEKKTSSLKNNASHEEYIIFNRFSRSLFSALSGGSCRRAAMLQQIGESEPSTMSVLATPAVQSAAGPVVRLAVESV